MNQRIVFINFATTRHDTGFRNLEHYQQRLNRSAKRVGLTNINAWNRQRLLKTEFYHAHRHILDDSVGAGYWLWKPYIILETMKQVAEGDIVFYVDSDMEFVANPQPLIDTCLANDGIFLIEERTADKRNRCWTKRDCFHFMDLDTEYFHNAYHSGGGIQIYVKSNRTMDFVEEYLHYAGNRAIISDDPNICGKPNLDGFVAHRRDQSVLSLLRVKHNIEGFRWPTQWGNHFKSEGYRVEGEWLAEPYSQQPYTNSPYATILHHGKPISPQTSLAARLFRRVLRTNPWIQRTMIRRETPTNR